MPYPNISPIAFHIGDWPVHWYGIMYALAFAFATLFGRRLLKQNAFRNRMKKFVADDLLFAALFGVLLGGRLGYVIFYQPEFYFKNPTLILQVWSGGMSFHGGLLGVIVAIFYTARRSGLPFWRIADFAAVLTPIGLGLGRIGNFINGELPGRVAGDWLPWHLIYNHIDSLPRHPSAIYQALLEGVVLFALMLYLSRRRQEDGTIAASFLIGYAVCRLISEMFREPDAHLGLLWGLTMGQWLSLPMLFFGAWVLYWVRNKGKK